METNEQTKRRKLMRDVAIVNPVRTAVGRFGGALKDVSGADLGTKVIEAILEQTGLDPATP